MSRKNSNILTIIRGDTAKFHFHRENAEGEIIDTEPDKIYFTVKNSPKDSKVMFQKTIDDMTFDEEFEYHFTVEPEDTNHMNFANYYYDIEVIDEGVKTTISYGVFALLPEVTHAGNEV